MNETTERGSLELEVTDFGPIVEAKVDLRPLTVFIGPSNTGKSYLAILIYALHRYFCGNTGRGPWRFRRRYSTLRGRDAKELPDATVDALRKTALAFLDHRKSPDQRSVVLPPPVSDLIASDFDAGGNQLNREIARCFGIDHTGTLIRKGQKGSARIVLQRPMWQESERFEHGLTLPKGQKITSKTIIPKQIPIRIDADDNDETDEFVDLMNIAGWKPEEREFIVWRYMGVLNNLILAQLTSPLHLPAYYLPADRTGVMHAHSVVVSALIGSAPTAGLRPAIHTPVLSGVLADFLEQLIGIDRPRGARRKPEQDLGAKIETAVLGGTVRVERAALVDYPRFAYRPEGWKHDLALANASSMVSELAPVVLYLRHMVRPDNVLIVEEPESHLHPAMQVEFTRQLATLVRSGVRVIVTTHSEWLLEELANIVRRSQIPETKGAATGGGHVALASDDVGVWLFEPKKRPKGSVVKEIRLDESGLYPSGFDEVATALHNDWADISSSTGETP